MEMRKIAELCRGLAKHHRQKAEQEDPDSHICGYNFGNAAAFEMAVAWLEKALSAEKGHIFENDNGKRYFVVAGDDQEALLRDMDRGGYVIARGLDWTNMCWRGGSYFSSDEFEVAVKAFLEERRDEEQCE